VLVGLVGEGLEGEAGEGALRGKEVGALGLGDVDDQDVYFHTGADVLVYGAQNIVYVRGAVLSRGGDDT
jgi:hypothetical protein